MSGFQNLKHQFEDMGENAFTIPNILSVLRIILIPVFVYLFLVQNYKAAVLAVFISGMTDLVDGKIARHFNQISKLGKMLDPAADKLTQMTLAVLLFFHFNDSEEETIKVFSYVFLLFILKEFLMIVASFVLLSWDILPQVSVLWGKCATFFFYIVIGLLLCFAPGCGALEEYYIFPTEVIIGMVSASAFLTISAFFAYVPDTLKQMRIRKERLAAEAESEV